MRTSDYTQLPSKSKWKKDSYLLVGIRDQVLRNIDNLVGLSAIAADGGEKINYYFQLYFALDYWLGHHAEDRAMNSKREPAIKVLYKFIAFELCKCMDCTINTLPVILEEYFGRQMTAHGHRIDSAGRAYTPDRARVEKYRLHWSSKEKIFRHLQGSSSNYKMLPAKSHYIQYMDSTKDGLKANYANFVLTMGGDFYMAPHIETKTQSWFHSSYNGGQAVLCAGSIFVDDGIVEGVQNNSGHYQPTDNHMVNVIRHLQMLGHPIADIKVWNYTGKLWFPAGQFLADNGNWEAAVKRSGAAFRNWQSRMDAHGQKSEVLRKFNMGVPLRTLVDMRVRATGREFHSVWDEIVLEIMSVDPTYRRHLNVLIGTPEKSGQDAPILSRPARPTTRPWKAA